MFGPIRKIVVAAADGGAHQVIQRAARLAAKLNATVDVISVVSPSMVNFVGSTAADRRELADELVRSREAELARLSRPLSRRGIAFNCSVLLAPDVTGAILRYIAKTRADLLAIEAHKHSALARFLLSQTDYALIRQCPRPLLIAKGSPPAEGAPILAALDPWHTSGKPKTLDRTIVEAARSLAYALEAPLHTAHAHAPLVSYVGDAGFGAVTLPVSQSDERRYAAAIKRRFRAVNGRFGVPAARAHLASGNPDTALPALARAEKAQVLVMGAVSRSAIKRVFIGNTAERVVDAMPCDILIVKPAALRGRSRG